MTVWKSVGENYLYGIAKNNFYKKNSNQLSLDVGDAVLISKECADWYYGFSKNNSDVRGIFPKNYIQIMESYLLKKEYVIKRTEIVDELTTVLREWGDIFKKFYLTNHESIKQLRDKIIEVIRLRSQILSGNLPVDEMKEIKLMATSEIDTGNKILGLDMVVRDENGNVLDINKTSTTQLYSQHASAENRIKMASSINKNRLSKTVNKHSHNVLLNVHAFVCKYQEDSDLLFTLYDAEEHKAITESYVVKWGRQGLARDMEQFDNHRVLFTDLGSSDLNRNKIYLICYAIRIGGMECLKDLDSRRSSMATVVLQQQSKKYSGSNSSSINSASLDYMRRPFGVAAIDLTPIIKKPDDFKNNLDLPFILCEKECLDQTLNKLITINSKSDSKIAVSVEVLHGDIKQIKEEFPHLVHSNVAFARKMGFPEVIFPGDVRNDLYLTMVAGDFNKTFKSSDKNIEVMVVVCNENGSVVPGVITLGAGSVPLNEYKSVIYYHDDKPKWNETFKIQLPIEDFKQCHLRFTFKHRSSNENKDRTEKPFGLSYVKLMQENGTTLQHSNHKLCVYKIDYKKYDEDTQYNYLNLPAQSKNLIGNQKPAAIGFSLAPNNFFEIGTNLCSTKLTQNVDLLEFLNWSSHQETLEDSLNALMKVCEGEIVKFLQDILDALFNILVQNDNPEKYDELVFKCILKLIEVVTDLKYQHFQSVLDLYINESFSATLAYDKLLNVLQKHIQNTINNASPHAELDFSSNLIDGEYSTEKILFRTTKYIPYIIKFIIRSRILFSNLNDDMDSYAFKASLDTLLESFKKLIVSQNVLRSQGFLLKYLHIIASDLMQVYNADELSIHITNIITNIPPGLLSQSKLTCIKDLIDSKLFKLPECRKILLPVFCEQIKSKLENKEENKLMQQEKNLDKAAKVLGYTKSELHSRETSAKTELSICLNIMNQMLDMLFRDDIGPTENDVRDIMLILLNPVIKMSCEMDWENPIAGNLIAIMLGIFRSMKSVHYSIYVENFENKLELQVFLVEILLLFRNLVSKCVFKNDWMDMIMHQNTIILESLKNISSIIMQKFHQPFEHSVWLNYFDCSIAFLIQPALQLDQFSFNKKSNILARYKDIRHETVIQICDMWFNLGEHKVLFVPQLVGSILEMSFIPERELQKATIPIFFDMMQCEYYTSKFVNESYGDTKRNTAHIKGNFNDFEKEIIEKLDILVEGGCGDEEYKILFHDIMMEKCMEHATLSVEGINFVNIVTKLLERLLEYRCIINDESKENRMSCTVSLLQFYAEVNRREMYIRYVYKLCDLHMEFDNYTEAAFALKLHSNLLEWNDNLLSPLLRSHRHSNCQTHRHLKEALYHEILDYFDKGKMWECALDMCKELATQYEDVVFDFLKLSKIHDKMSKFYVKILKEMRHESEYFRVGFYGLKFPEFIRNKIFIYRGKEYERLSEFCTRILNQHPTADLMQTLTSPGIEITQADGQFIQVNSVEPVPCELSKRFSGKNVAGAIVKYHLTNNVQTFRFSRPFRDIKEGEDHNHVGNLWLERTIMNTTYKLPGILRWFPVEKAETFRISPLEYAIETMETANKALRDLILAHKADETLPINPLSMKINGIVDPAVMGGFGKYEEAFLTPEYLEKKPLDQALVDKLKDLIASQIPLLEIAVLVHKNKLTASLQPFHERLEKCFSEMQANVEMKYGKRSSDLKIERESFVVLRRQSQAQNSIEMNRLSETSIGSSDSSGWSKSTSSRPATSSSLKSTFNSAFNFNSANLSRGSQGGNSPGVKKNKEKTPSKRRSSKKIDRESLTLPIASSQWYTNSLTPISSTPTDNNSSVSTSTASSTNSPVVELTEELTPKRPLRSEVEREKRLSRPTSIATPVPSIKEMSLNNNGDNCSLSGESSNRNSIITTDSTNSEEDLIPPPLPAKARDSHDYSNTPASDIAKSGYRTLPKPFRPLPGSANSNYDSFESKIFIVDDKKRPPTPPPKPSRNSKYVPAT